MIRLSQIGSASQSEETDDFSTLYSTSEIGRSMSFGAVVNQLLDWAEHLLMVCPSTVGC